MDNQKFKYLTTKLISDVVYDIQEDFVFTSEDEFTALLETSFKRYLAFPVNYYLTEIKSGGYTVRTQVKQDDGCLAILDFDIIPKQAKHVQY